MDARVIKSIIAVLLAAFLFIKYRKQIYANKWALIIILSLIWGSSFILIKKGLVGLSAMQLGALRIIMSGIVVIGLGYKQLKEMPKASWKYLILAGFLGTFFPSFFFAYAETEIDSAVASMLNSLVPLITIITGVLLFRIKTGWMQVLGVLIGLSGTAILILKGASINPDQNYYYSLFVISSTVMYALNVNIVKRYLQNLNALGLTAGTFLFIVPFALGVLIYTGFFKTEVMTSNKVLVSIGYVLLLSVFGTALAKVLFNRLIQISNPVFSTSVTYLMPVVAIFWGLLDGERITLVQILAAGLILGGVYLVNKKAQKKEP
ncbi:EamA family transporter [Spongiivirga citrea]|uniref:EamA family transporter n=2 Tax=Spongiivirga citrea TaxID=1481457 RepID=A0A6M0CNJ4_9FLAO|nr:EamA family transporter [Spongiivirga citrea]